MLIMHIYLCFCVSDVPEIGKNSIVFTVCCCYSGVTCPTPFLTCTSPLKETAITAQTSSFRMQYFPYYV